VSVVSTSVIVAWAHLLQVARQSDQFDVSFHSSLEFIHFQQPQIESRTPHIDINPAITPLSHLSRSVLCRRAIVMLDADGCQSDGFLIGSFIF